MEQFPNPESVERNTLIEALRTRGAENEEVLEMLILWTEKKEQEVERIGTREAQLDFEMDRAQLYLEAGLIQQALWAFEDALIVASNESLHEYVQQIEEKIDSLQ